jgi:hypothetical protein
VLTWESDVEVTALRKRGWTIAAIAKHTGFERKTVRKYLAGAGSHCACVVPHQASEMSSAQSSCRGTWG